MAVSWRNLTNHGVVLVPFHADSFQWSFLLFSNISPLWSTHRVIIYCPASHRCSSSDL